MMAAPHRLRHRLFEVQGRKQETGAVEVLALRSQTNLVSTVDARSEIDVAGVVLFELPTPERDLESKMVVENFFVSPIARASRDG